MSRAHLHKVITDSDGNVVPNTVVTIYEAGTGQLIAQPLYVQKVGSPVWQNPRTTSDGYVDFYLDRPQSVRIGLAVQGATETYVDDVPVMPAPENLVQSVQAFQVQNVGVDGWFLQAGQVGQAAWVDAGDLVNSKPSPLHQIYTYDFSGGLVDDLLITNEAGTVVVPGFPTVTGDSKPAGWTFDKAIQLPTSGKVRVRTPTQTWSETGTVIFLYKVVSANQGQGAAILHVTVDDDLLYAETPVSADLTNIWMVGYLDEIPSGTHRLTIEHRPGYDLDSYVLIGPIWLQYGNNIPAHDHPGPNSQSVRLGTDSQAPYAGSTVIGALAQSQGPNATALGVDAQAGAGSVAAGAVVRAGIDSVAVGYRSSSTGRTGAVTIGKDTAAGGDAAVAIGPTALAQGPSSVAVGSGARTGTGGDSVALGSNAQALGYRSVALGQGALVGATHDYSIAIGNGVVTTADHQARIGDAATTVVIPGNFRQVGGNAAFGAAAGKLGFFGSAGILRPTVTGSRGGNATLASLLTLLASMGLIQDGTTP